MSACVSGKTYRLDHALVGKTKNISEKFTGTTYRKGILKGYSFDITNHLVGKCLYSSERLTGRCSIICSVAELKYLNVSPEEVVWITPDKGVVYEVDSNTEWIIVIN